MLDANMTAREKIILARVTLLRDYPFFGTLVMRLTPIELTKEEAQQMIPNPGGGEPTMGVDIYGNVPYNKEWVRKLNHEEIFFVLCHEVMHLALNHLTRAGSRDRKLFNVATDEAINNLLKNEMSIMKGTLCHPEFEEKSAEEIYDELLDQVKIKKTFGGKCPNSFDVHQYEDPTSKKPGSGNKNSKTGAGQGNFNQSPFKKSHQEKLDPDEMVKNAAKYAMKSRGTLPAGMERLFKDLLSPKMNWKEVLQKFIMAVIPQDWTYTKPSKRAQAAGFYMPSVMKETVEIMVGVDSSGSISDEEYNQFLSEIVAMTRAVQNLKATVLICDAQLSQAIEITNSFDVEMKIKGRGYGGTSCHPVFDWIHNEKRERCKLLVYLTDGWIDEPQQHHYETGYPVLWIITPKGSVDFLHNPIGKQIVIQMEGKIGDGRRRRR